MTLGRLPWGISRSLERLVMAQHATDVLVVPVLLSEVRPVKQQDGGDIGDEGRGSRRDACRPLQPMKLHILSVGMSEEGLMWSDEVEHGLWWLQPPVRTRLR